MGMWLIYELANIVLLALDLLFQMSSARWRLRHIVFRAWTPFWKRRRTAGWFHSGNSKANGYEILLRYLPIHQVLGHQRRERIWSVAYGKTIGWFLWGTVIQETSGGSNALGIGSGSLR